MSVADTIRQGRQRENPSYGSTTGSTKNTSSRKQVYVDGVKVSDTDRVKTTVAGETKWVTPDKLTDTTKQEQLSMGIRATEKERIAAHVQLANKEAERQQQIRIKQVIENKKQYEEALRQSLRTSSEKKQTKAEPIKATIIQTKEESKPKKYSGSFGADNRSWYEKNIGSKVRVTFQSFKEGLGFEKTANQRVRQGKWYEAFGYTLGSVSGIASNKIGAGVGKAVVSVGTKAPKIAWTLDKANRVISNKWVGRALLGSYSVTKAIDMTKATIKEGATGFSREGFKITRDINFMGGVAKGFAENLDKAYLNNKWKTEKPASLTKQFWESKANSFAQANAKLGKTASFRGGRRPNIKKTLKQRKPISKGELRKQTFNRRYNPNVNYDLRNQKAVLRVRNKQLKNQEIKERIIKLNPKKEVVSITDKPIGNKKAGLTTDYITGKSYTNKPPTPKKSKLYPSYYGKQKMRGPKSTVDLVVKKGSRYTIVGKDPGQKQSKVLLQVSKGKHSSKLFQKVIRNKEPMRGLPDNKKTTIKQLLQKGKVEPSTSKVAYAEKIIKKGDGRSKVRLEIINRLKQKSNQRLITKEITTQKIFMGEISKNYKLFSTTNPKPKVSYPIAKTDVFAGDVVFKKKYALSSAFSTKTPPLDGKARIIPSIDALAQEGITFSKLSPIITTKIKASNVLDSELLLRPDTKVKLKPETTVINTLRQDIIPKTEVLTELKMSPILDSKTTLRQQAQRLRKKKTTITSYNIYTGSPTPVPTVKNPPKTPPKNTPRRINKIFQPPKQPKIRIRPKIPKIPGLPNFKRQDIRGDKLTKGFDVYVRIKGRFRKVNPGPLSKLNALGFGAKFVKGSAAATFKLVDLKRKISNQNNKFKNFFSSSQFRIKGSSFIEKNKYRINTLGELNQITFKGLASKRSKKFGGVL